MEDMEISFDFEAYRAKKRHTATEKAAYILACEEVRQSVICEILDEFEHAIRNTRDLCDSKYPDFAKDIEKIEKRILRSFGRWASLD